MVAALFPPSILPPIASQLLWLAITFGAVLPVSCRGLSCPRIGGILGSTGRDRIAQDLDEANRLKEEADEAIAAYEQELADARKEGLCHRRDRA